MKPLTEFRAVAASMTPTELDYLLDTCDKVITILRDDPVYKRLVEQGEYPLNFLTLIYDHPDPVVRWMNSLRAVASVRNKNLLLTHFSVFLIGQSYKEHRIKDDKERLLLTYLHIRTIKDLINES